MKHRSAGAHSGYGTALEIVNTKFLSAFFGRTIRVSGKSGLHNCMNVHAALEGIEPAEARRLGVQRRPGIPHSRELLAGDDDLVWSEGGDGGDEAHVAVHEVLLVVRADLQDPVRIVAKV